MTVFKIPDSGIFYSVQRKGSRAVDTRSAHAARLIAALVAAPRVFIRYAELEALSDDVRFCEVHKRRLDPQPTPAALIDRLIHRVLKRLAAVGIGVARRVVAMGSVKDNAAVL